MSNKNLIIGLGVALLAYYFYDKKQKEKIQATPYTDTELDKVANDFISEERKRALEINPNSNPIEIEKGNIDLRLSKLKQLSDLLGVLRSDFFD